MDGRDPPRQRRVTGRPRGKALDEARLQAIEVRSLATDKLLKALIALLMVREESLLDELGAVFALAEFQDNEVGQSPQDVWLELRHEMKVLRDLARAGDAAGNA